MNKLNRIQEALHKVDHQKPLLTFPQLLQQLRGCYGMTRRNLCREIGINEMRMFTLENGTFGLIMDEEISKLAEYYDMDKEFLMEKARCFVSERKGRAHVEYKG